MYQKNVANGYIISIVKGIKDGNITEQEYSQIVDKIKKKPIAPKGYEYLLRNDLIWELCELPTEE